MSGVDLVYICDWLPPDYGPTGQYAVGFARERAMLGEHVYLYGLSSSPSSTSTERFAAGSLTIIRVCTDTYDRANFRDRAVWTIRTNLSLIGHAWRHLLQCKEILFTGSPPFLIHLLAPLNIAFRKKLTYRITDFFPESMMAQHERVPLALRALYRLTVFWRKRVTQFEALGEDQKTRLTDIGIPPERILLKRDPSPVEIPSTTQPFPRAPELANYKILLYSGNFGVVHDHLTFLNAFERHHRRGNGRVAFWLNAVGARANMVEEELRRRRLPHLRTKPVPLGELARLLVTPDAHLITLLEEHWGYSLPSKVHGCILSRLPVIYVGPKQSDVHLLCSSLMPAQQYQYVALGDEDRLFQVLESLGVSTARTSAVAA